MESVNGSYHELEFATGIRVGDDNFVKSFLDGDITHILESRLMLDIKLKLINGKALNETKKYSSSTLGDRSSHEGMVTMKLFPIHLAILAKQNKIVKILLNHAWRRNNISGDNAKKMLTLRTEISFPQNNPQIFHEDDRMLDGMNPLHVAAKYHSKSLYTIIQFLIQEDLIDDLICLFEETDKHLGNTPLHVAAKCSDSVSLR